MWRTYDGREQSLLRAAASDVLPDSVVKRVKSSYPSTSDPQYGTALQAHAKDSSVQGDDVLFGLVDRDEVSSLVSLDQERLESKDRRKLDRVLDLSVWLNLYEPEIVV